MKHPAFLLFAVSLLAGCSANAAIQTIVPRQGAMLMPDVFYHPDTDSLTVDLSNATNIIPQLTPLLVSHPGDSFSPDDPWFDDLDPSRQGKAFSRRYGWEFLTIDDEYLPWNRAMWVRKLASSPGLSFYDYSEEITPKTWNPIFGTAGTANEVYWDGVMWHFGVTAAPGTNTFSATFEIFLRDTDTGEEVANSSTGPFVLTWTEVPDGRPTLAISPETNNHFTVFWPTPAANWALFVSTNLGSTNWTAATSAVQTLGTNSFATFTNTAARQFFRLERNP